MRIPTPTLVLMNFVILLLTFTLVAAGFTGGYLYIRAVASDRTPAQAALIELKSIPPKKAICPGDNLDYIFAVQQLRSPLIVHIAKTVVSLEQAKTVIPQKSGEVELRVWSTLVGFEQRESYHIPKFDAEGDPIMAGMYELRVGLVAEGAASSVFALPFQVMNCG